MQLVEVGLSASNFRDQAWKLRAVAVANDAATTLRAELSARDFYVALVGVRKGFLAHLYRPQSEWQAKNIKFPVVDHRTKAFSSMLTVLTAREHVGLNTLAAALEHLANFRPDWNGVISQLGETQYRQVALTRANVLRCQGRFQEAYNILLPLGSSGSDSKIGSLLGSVLCELGDCDKAIQGLNMLLGNIHREKSVMRIKLALGNAYLVKCMQAFQGQGLDWQILQKSRHILQDVGTYTFPATYYGKIDQLSVSIGLAIGDQLNGQVDDALRGWQVVSATSQAFLGTGYTDMIFAYSTSELQMRRGATAQSEILMNYARTLFARTGRQYHFVGLGSYWMDIVKTWWAAHGREPLA